MPTNFSIGLSALRTSQFALEVVSNNIANANTEGYHRRSVHLESMLPNQLGKFRVGSGVTVNYIERIRDSVTESSLTNAVSDVSHVDQLLLVERQIEAALLSGNSSVSGELDRFFAELTKLTAAPDEPAQRTAVIETGQRLSGTIRQAANHFADLKDSIRFQIKQELDLLNEQMHNLSDLNVQIQSLTAQGYPANAELDQRDALINEIARVIGISRNDYRSGELNLMIGTASIQQVNIVNKFSLGELPDGRLGVFLDESDRPLDMDSGRLDALIELYNDTVPKYEAKLDAMARELIQSFDSIHATGIGTDGSFQHLVGSRTVNDPVIPLADAETAFDISAGDLTVTITQPDGIRRTEVVSIDPAVDSLADVAGKLSAIDGLSATIDTNVHRLRIYAAHDHRFDFTGTVETHPDLAGFTGTSLPEFSGIYSGEANEQLSFQIEGSGDVGISDDLYINVYTQSGALKSRVNIGNGYETGSTIDLGDGIQLSMSAGTVVDGEQFDTQLTAEPDETGFLAALGVNSFFKGISAGTIDVDSSVIDNPGRFAAGASGDAADTSNTFRLKALEDHDGLPGNLTFAEYVNEINTEIGFQINSNQALSTSLHALKLRIEQDRDATSGVDLNEEMVYLQQFQKSYEAAVRVIQAADDILDDLFTILR